MTGKWQFPAEFGFVPQSPSRASLVVPGLDPGIHGRAMRRATMDRRVEPGDDKEPRFRAEFGFVPFQPRSRED